MVLYDLIYLPIALGACRFPRMIFRIEAMMKEEIKKKMEENPQILFGLFHLPHHFEESTFNSFTCDISLLNLQ